MTGFVPISRRFAVLFLLPLGAFAAADPALLQMIPSDAQAVSGLQVMHAKNSPFGQYLLAQLPLNDAQLDDFIAQTGFDPRQDVSEIVIASNSKPNTPNNRWILAAHGTFNAAKITAAAQANGGEPATYQGIKLVTHTARKGSELTTAFGFLDANTALAGDLASVQAAIDRKQSNAPADSALLNKVQEVSANNDLWFVTRAPLSNFAGQIPDPNLSGAMQGNMLAAVNQTSGGVSFGDKVTISAQAVTRSAKDAQALVDVVRFFAGLAQLNRQNSPALGQAATLLDGLETSTSGNTMTLSLAIPEQQLEQLLNSARPHGRRASLRIN